MRKLQTYLFLTAILMTQSLFAGGDLVNNGGGIAEKNFVFAYQGLDRYIELCLSLDVCKLNSKQRDLLHQIKSQLPHEYAKGDQLQFSSEKKNPGFFLIDGEIKIAKTGSTVGSPIFINEDLLYSKNSHDIYIPLSLSEAVAVLIHELGHHQSEATHQELDLLGVRVAMLLNQKLYESPLLPWSNDIKLTVLNYDSAMGFPEVLLVAGEDVVDLTKLYRKSVRCPIVTIPIPIFPIPDWDAISAPAKGSLMHNLHWEKAKSNEDQAKMVLSANISNQCEDSKSFLYLNNDFRLNLEFKMKRQNGKWHVDLDSIEMKQFKNPWWKLLRFSF